MSNCSKRCADALSALLSDSMPLVLDAVMRANAVDNEKYDGHQIVFSGISSSVVDNRSWPNKAMLLLNALDNAFVDALYVVMYVGRDEVDGEHPYDEFEVDTQFIEWWDFMNVDGEQFAREQMSEKWPLGRYLRRGARLFRVYAP